MEEQRREAVNALFDNFIRRLEAEIKSDRLTEVLASVIMNIYMMKEASITNGEQTEAQAQLLSSFKRAIDIDNRRKDQEDGRN